MVKQSFILRDAKVRANCLTAVALAPEGFEVTIGPKKKTRPQERFLHAILGIISKETGMPLEDLKDSIKIPILGFTEHKHKDKIYYRVKSSVSINDKQYSELIEAAKMIAQTLNIRLPASEFYGY